MPIYEYTCCACGHHHEALQKVGEGALRKCPACGKLKLQRLVSAPRFRLKGGGWYETDFKKDRQRNLADRPEKTDKAAEGADKKAAEGKPDKGRKEKKDGKDGKAKGDASQAVA